MVISFNNNNIHEAVSTDSHDKESLQYIYIDREKNLMVACNTRILVTIPIEFDKEDKVPDSVKHLYLSKEMFLYAKKNKCPIIFTEDGIYINNIRYPYLDIGAYAPYQEFLINDDSTDYSNVFECRLNTKDLLAIVKANCSNSTVDIQFKMRNEKIQFGLCRHRASAFGIVHDSSEKIGLFITQVVRYNISEADISKKLETN